MKSRFIALLFCLITSPLAFAQAAQHTVTLNWTDTTNPSGTSYTVYRASGLCSGTPTFSKQATAVAVKTYVDSTVTPGNYCYQVTAVFTGVESAPSNTTNPMVPTFAPTNLTSTVAGLEWLDSPVMQTEVVVR